MFEELAFLHSNVCAITDLMCPLMSLLLVRRELLKEHTHLSEKAQVPW